MTGPETVAAELDERHRAANLAYATRDLAAYRALFSPTLAYRRADGTVIDRDRLMRDVAAQFSRLHRATSSFVRETLDVADDEVTETLAQIAYGDATAFGLIHRRWKVDRHGAYTWTKRNGVWTIERVHITSETMTPEGWRFGLRGFDAR
jgi:hypothetical protein